MAIRMQQRRGTASQWTTANPILNAGEIGWESDNNKFKIGDGTNHWADLNYFVDGAELSNIIDGAPALLDTLNELAAAIGDDPAFFTTVATNLSNHQSDTTNIHGITDTAELATKEFAASLLTGASKSNITITGDKNGLTITAENGVADSTTDALSEGTSNKYFTDERAQDAVGNAVGTGLSYDDATGAISVDTVTIATQEYVDGAVSNAEVDQSTLAGSGISWNVATSQFDVDTTTIQARVADVSDTEIGYLNGVTSGVQDQLDDKAPIESPTFTGTVSGITKSMVGLGNVDNTADADKPISTATQSALDDKLDSTTAASTYAPLAGATFTGDVTVETNLTIDGNLTVSGTTTTVNATDLVVTDPLIYIGEGNSGNLVDLGLVGSFNDGTYQHAGLVRDSSAGTWKLFKGVTDEPTTTINFAQGSLDDLSVAGLAASSITLGGLDVATESYVDGAVSNAEVDQSTLAGYGITWNASTSQFDVNTSTIQARVADVSDTEIGYLNGVTSAIQTQIDGKSPTAGNTSLVTLGTVTTGTWNATTIATTKGGTGLTGFTAGDMIYASATDTLAKLAKGSANQVMYMNSAGTAPEWRTAAAGAAFSELMLIGA